VALLGRVEDELAVVDLKRHSVVVVKHMFSLLYVHFVKSLSLVHASHPQTLDLVVGPWFVVFLFQVGDGLLEYVLQVRSYFSLAVADSLLQRHFLYYQTIILI
jgi:hypothetical protein